MRRTLEHSGERELQQEREEENRRDSLENMSDTKTTSAEEQRSSYPEASDLCLRINEPEKINTYIHIKECRERNVFKTTNWERFTTIILFVSVL